MSPRHSVFNYFQRNSSENVLTRLWFRWKSHRNKNGIECLPDTYLAKNQSHRIAPQSMLKRTSAKCFTVKFLKFKFLVCNTRSNSCLESFQTKCSNIWQPDFVFKLLECLYASTRSRLPHRYFWNTLTTNQKLPWRPASVTSVNKESSRPGFIICLFFGYFNHYIIRRRAFGDREVSLFDRKTRRGTVDTLPALTENLEQARTSYNICLWGVPPSLNNRPDKQFNKLVHRVSLLAALERDL